MNYKSTILGGVIAFIIASSCCWLPAIIIAVGGGTALLAISDGLEQYSVIFILLGLSLFGIGIYQLKNKPGKKNIIKPILQSTISCPDCGHKKEESMPIDACQFFYECENCNTIIRPKGGDCCVYCSYGTIPCPPIQLNNPCC